MASKDHERVFKWVSRDFNIFQTLIRSSSLKEFWEPGALSEVYGSVSYPNLLQEEHRWYCNYCFQGDIFISRVDGDGRHRGQTAGGKFTERTSKWWSNQHTVYFCK